MSLFKFLFNCRLKFRRFLYQNRYLIERMYSTAWFLMFSNIILTLIIRNRFSEAMLVIISICFFLIDFIRSLNKMTTSLRSFLLDSVFLELISLAVLFDVFNKIAHLGNNSYDFISAVIGKYLTPPTTKIAFFLPIKQMPRAWTVCIDSISNNHFMVNCQLHG